MKNENKEDADSIRFQKLQFLQMITGKWKLPILCALSTKDRIRFNELKRQLNGITNMSLTNCLQELERYKIVQRIQYLEMPPRVEYSLTENGKKLLPSLKAFNEWAEKQLEISNEPLKSDE
jgi:DNA-binding HxlR family transcriptional regulator